VSLRSELARLRRVVSAQLPPDDGERVTIFIPWNRREPLVPSAPNDVLQIYEETENGPQT